MKRVAGVLALLVLGSPVRTSQPRETLRHAGAIELPRVEGRIDHLAVDFAGRRLYVAALGNNTVEVLDVAAGEVTKSIAGFDEPQGIRYLQESRRIVVANGGSGDATVLDGTTFAVAARAKLSGDADNVRFDAKAGRVYVGYASGALAVLDINGQRLGNIALSGHPESFQLETSGPRIFVNVPSAGHIAVIDRVSKAVVGTWPVTAARANYPMALDEARHRVFVGCRSPARLLVYDSDTGRLVTSIEIVGDTDDLFYDERRRRLYVIGGEGFVTALEQQDADHYRPLQRLATAAGARTGLFVPELNRLFVAVPHRGNQRAEVRIYEPVD